MVTPVQAHRLRIVAGIVLIAILCGVIAATLQLNVFDAAGGGDQPGGASGALRSMFWTGYAYAFLPIAGIVLVASLLLYDRIETLRKGGSLSISDRIFEHSRNGVAIIDPNGYVQHINPAYSNMTGYAEAELLGRRLRDVLNSGRQLPQFYEDLWQTLREQGHWEGEIWNRRKDGGIYLESIAIKGLDQEGQRGDYESFMIVATDITQRHLDHEYLGYLALHDALTGLPNRLQFIDRAEQAIARAQRASSTLALLFIDLDGFKEVNDTCGHASGDIVLKVVAERLRHSLRGTDTVARLSGDEFTVILEGLSGAGADCIEQINNITRMLLSSLAQPIDVDGRRVSVGASIGVSFYPDAPDFQQLLERADQAMYRAKAAGKNRVRFYSVLPDAAVA